jgi:hypothetical protein
MWGSSLTAKHRMKPLPFKEIQQFNLLVQDFVVLGVRELLQL